MPDSTPVTLLSPPSASTAAPTFSAVTSVRMRLWSPLFRFPFTGMVTVARWSFSAAVMTSRSVFPLTVGAEVRPIPLSVKRIVPMLSPVSSRALRSYSRVPSSLLPARQGSWTVLSTSARSLGAMATGRDIRSVPV